jgi:hypothetical protein
MDLETKKLFQTVLRSRIMYASCILYTKPPFKKMLAYYMVEEEPEPPKPKRNFYAEPEPNKDDADPQY